ncbi:hypothetical protein BC830DRAFT_1162747 [Chytriomyces sp. MP71]|nr:hypothetical protein BC830DRAFT_1162747 [Chytriomyces sp. MP71]
MAAKQPRVRNAVHDAAIWRQTIHYELATAQNWERYWGFMKDAMIDNEEAIKAARADKTNKRVLPPIHRRGGKLQPKKSEQEQQPAPETVTKHVRPSSPPPMQIHASGLPSRLPPGIVMPKDDPILEDLLITYRIPAVIRSRMPAEKYKTPCTTSSEIGWVWGHSKDATKEFDASKSGVGAAKAKFHTLERFPREAHGKGDVMKWWGGGRESLP